MNYIGQSLVALDHTSCRLKWTASTSTDLDGYYVYMSEFDRDHFQRLTPQPIDEAEWISPPLRNDASYYFYITAVDRSGNESDPSNVYHFQMPDVVPDTNLIVVDMPTTVKVTGGSTFTDDTQRSNFVTSFTLGG